MPRWTSVWDITNDVENWPTLFTEYASAEILEHNGNTVRFRLTMHPDQNGKIWSWVSERTTDPQNAFREGPSRRDRAVRFHEHRVVFEPDSATAGTKMRWVQEFHMKPTAPADDDRMENNINTNTEKQMAIIKERRSKSRSRGRRRSAHEGPSILLKRRRTKIVATIGPASSDPAVIEQLIARRGQRVSPEHVPRRPRGPSDGLRADPRSRPGLASPSPSWPTCAGPRFAWAGSPAGRSS